MKLRLRQAIVIVLSGFFIITPATATALTSDQQNLLRSGIHYFDISGSSCSTAGSSSASTPLTGSDNIQKAFNYFKNKGLSDMQAAAVVGNLKQESTLNPTIMEKGGNSKNPADGDPLGWGIAQWTPGSKIIPKTQQLGISGPIYELGTQLDIVYAEMKGAAPTGYQNVLSGLQKTTTLADAVEFFRANYESGTMGNRQTYAQQIFKQYGGTSSGGAAVTGIDAPVGCSSAGAVNCTNPTAPADGSSGALSTVRQNAVCLAQAEYQKWQSGQMGPGGDFKTYTQGADQEWCADFVSWVYNEAGYPIGSGNNWRVPAVDGVRQIGEQGGRFTYHDAGSYTPVPGDMAIHSYSHVNMIVSVNQNKHTMVAIGGNEGNISTNSQSLVKEDHYTSYTDDSIIGYVSPKE